MQLHTQSTYAMSRAALAEVLITAAQSAVVVVAPMFAPHPSYATGFLIPKAVWDSEARCPCARVL